MDARETRRLHLALALPMLAAAAALWLPGAWRFADPARAYFDTLAESPPRWQVLSLALVVLLPTVVMVLAVPLATSLGRVLRRGPAALVRGDARVERDAHLHGSVRWIGAEVRRRLEALRFEVEERPSEEDGGSLVFRRDGSGPFAFLFGLGRELPLEGELRLRPDGDGCRVIGRLATRRQQLCSEEVTRDLDRLLAHLLMELDDDRPLPSASAFLAHALALSSLVVAGSLAFRAGVPFGDSLVFSWWLAFVAGVTAVAALVDCAVPSRRRVGAAAAGVLVTAAALAFGGISRIEERLARDAGVQEAEIRSRFVATTLAFDPSAPGGAPDGMVAVPAGSFLMGSHVSGDEWPIHEVELSAFFIDRTEVTLREFRRCVDSGGCEPPAGRSGREPCTWDRGGPDLRPIDCLTWEQARRFCAWAGKRLPSEAEWEKAARGTDGRRFPWGDDEPACRFAVGRPNRGDGCDAPADARPVGSMPDGASPYGALDMAGNVAEWTADLYALDYYERSPRVDPPGPEHEVHTWLQSAGRGPHHVLRGGSYRSSARAPIGLTLRSADRAWLDSGAGIGLRCALSERRR